MGFHVYILNCADGSYYTGHTDNLEARLVAHQLGQVPGYTQKRRPLRMVFAEELSSRQEAFERERQIKGWTRAKKRALIRSDWEHLISLSKGPGSTGFQVTVPKHVILNVVKDLESVGATSPDVSPLRLAQHDSLL